MQPAVFRVMIGGAILRDHCPPQDSPAHLAVVSQTCLLNTSECHILGSSLDHLSLYTVSQDCSNMFSRDEVGIFKAIEFSLKN